MIVAKESAAASCAAGWTRAKGLAASLLGTACSDCADRWTVGGMSATEVPKHRAATIAPRIMISSPTKVLDRVGCVEIWSKTVVEAKQLESMVLSLA